MNDYIAVVTTTSGDIYHHGIKGQKWGVRNYQYEDGSLTPEGLKRYGKGGAYTKSSRIREDLDISYSHNYQRRKNKIDKAKDAYKKGRLDLRLNSNKMSGHDYSVKKKQLKLDLKNAKKAAKQEHIKENEKDLDAAVRAFAQTTNRGSNITKSILATAGGIGAMQLGQSLFFSGSVGNTGKLMVAGTLLTIGGGALTGVGLTIGGNEAEAKRRGYR